MSTTATRFPCIANAAPIEAVMVVLPTPPFPEVTTITLPSTFYLFLNNHFSVYGQIFSNLKSVKFKVI